MPEASSRILVDRTTLRVDGRPFFSFGPRVLLTPAERLGPALKEIARCGFTAVGSPPCSPGTIALVQSFFDAAEEAGLMVVLIADPRLPEHGRYLAENFRSRASLHSYMLPPRPADRESLESFVRDRDALRALDLFHPIWMPLGPEQLGDEWLRNQDILAHGSTGLQQRGARIIPQRPGADLRSVAIASASSTSRRPLFCTDLAAIATEGERALGLFDDDPRVARLPDRPLDWFPYLANIATIPRRDALGPEPEMLRLQVYDLLASGARGILLDFWEGFAGPPPFSGRDRLAEATILAQEIAALHDFFSEGRLAGSIEVETGHPRLGAAVIRHGHELLVVLRMEGCEEDFFIDEAYLERTEISLRYDAPVTTSAWRLDFPGARPLEISRDAVGSIRFMAGPLELTGLALLTPGNRRSEDIANEFRDRLAVAARAAADCLEARLGKVLLIEGELAAIGAGIDNGDRLRVIASCLDEAKAFVATEDFADAYTRARVGMRYIRQLVKYQMARALAMPEYGGDSLRSRLRNSYFTLPRFYRESAADSARAFVDLT